MMRNHRGSTFFLFAFLLSLVLVVAGHAQDVAVASEIGSEERVAGLSPTETAPPRREPDKQVEAEGVPRKMPLPRGLDLWQRERDGKAARGWEYAFDYSGEFLHVYKNHDGKKKQVYLDNLNLKLGIDLEKANLGAKGRFFLYVLGNSGGNITGDHLDATGIGRVGDLQTLSNLETNETFRLYEAYFEWPVGKWMILAGIHDLNADFDNSEYAAFFSNSSFGIAPDISKNAPVSIFNVTSPALRLKFEPNSHWTVLAGIWDGYPGTPDENKRGFGLRITPREGYMNILEVQHHQNWFGRQLPGTIKLGNWLHTGRFDDLMNVDANGDPVRRRNNWGTYAVFDQKLWNRPNQPDQGIGGFVQVGGLTPVDRSLVERYVGVGLNFIGPFRNRPADVFGVAYAVADTSTALRDFNQAAGTLALNREKVMEIGYRIQVNDWLTVKPNVQFIKNPGADPTRGETRVFGLRFTTIF